MAGEKRKDYEPPVLSVVMPVHNPDRYLRPCLDSVLGQTFRDIEVIAVDDRSTDGALEVLEEYAAKDGRLRILQNSENLGAAPSRNRGLRHARGKYVIVLDADDFFDLTYFEDAVNQLERYQADVAVCPIWIHDETTGKETLSGNLSREQQRRISGTFNRKTFSGEFFTSFYIPPYCKVLRRDYIEKNHLEFQNLPNCNDHFFGIMALASAESVTYLPRAYVHYRVLWPGQISAKRGKNFYCAFEACAKVKEELQQCGFWGTCEKAFNSYALSSLLYIIKVADNSDEALRYLQKEGLVSLGMTVLHRENFLTYDRYGEYRLLNFRRVCLKNSKDIILCWLDALCRGDIVFAAWMVKKYMLGIGRRVVKVWKY